MENTTIRMDIASDEEDNVLSLIAQPEGIQIMVGDPNDERVPFFLTPKRGVDLHSFLTMYFHLTTDGQMDEPIT